MSSTTEVPGDSRGVEKSRDRSISSAWVAVESGRGRALLIARVLMILAGCGLFVLFGWNASPSLRYALTMSIVYAIAVLASGAVLGGLGEINLATGAYMAMGAYTCAQLLENGFGVIPAVLLATVATLLVGLLLAIPTVRLKGIFTALATFVLAYAVPQTIIYLDRWTGGSFGFSLPVGLEWAGLKLGGSSQGQFAFALVCFLTIALIHTAIWESRLGRRVLWVSEAPAAAAVFGVRIRVVQVLTWTWSAALAGLAGALFAITVGFLSLEQFPATLGITIFVASVVAGARSVWTALAGGLLVGLVPHELQSFIPSTATVIVFGLVLLGAILLGQGGLARLIESSGVTQWARLKGVKK